VVRRNPVPDERSEGMSEKPSTLSLAATLLAVALARMVRGADEALAQSLCP
jgi:hypothetical protein